MYLLRFLRRLKSREIEMYMRVYSIVLFTVLLVAVGTIDARRAERVRIEASGGGHDFGSGSGSGCLGDDEDCEVTTDKGEVDAEESGDGDDCLGDDEDCNHGASGDTSFPTEGVPTEEQSGDEEGHVTPEGSGEDPNGGSTTNGGCLEDDEDCGGDRGGEDGSGSGEGSGSGDDDSDPGYIGPK